MQIISIDFDVFSVTCYTWGYQDKCFSGITLKNRTSQTGSNWILKIEKCRSRFSCLVLFYFEQNKFWFSWLVNFKIFWCHVYRWGRLDEEASQSLKLSLCLPVTPQKPHKVKLKTPWHFLKFFQLKFPITMQVLSTTVNAVL